MNQTINNYFLQYNASLCKSTSRDFCLCVTSPLKIEIVLNDILVLLWQFVLLFLKRVEKIFFFFFFFFLFY